MNSQVFPEFRDKQIEFILCELDQLHPKSEVERHAIEENVLFFKSLRSVPRYVRWLYGLRRRIQGESLLEINELLPNLDEVFHAKMAEIERRPRPGIIRPVVDYITRLASEGPEERRLRVASLGSGSMEAERQSIERIQQIGNTRRFTIVGFDISPHTRAFAEKNLGKLINVRVVQETRLTEERLSVLEQETQESILIVISDNDIFTLSSDFSSNAFDLVMTSLFLHHLDEVRRKELIEHMKTLAPRVLNYDGYQNEVVIPILSLTGWHSPVFLNAAIFSTIRFPSRTQVLGLHSGAQIDFYNHGHYRAIFSS